MARLEGWSADEALRRCMEVDRSRERFTRYFFGEAAFQPASYDLVVNTGRVPLEDVVVTVAMIVRGIPSAETQSIPRDRGVLTLSRELGAGDTGFAPTLGSRLGLREFTIGNCSNRRPPDWA